MSFAFSSPIEYRLYGSRDSVVAFGGEQPYQILEVRLRYISRLISGFPYQILNETEPIRLESVLFPLPLHQLNHPTFFQIYIVHLLSSLSIRAAACEVIARQVASYVFQMAAGDGEMDLHIVADIDCIQTTLWIVGPMFGRSNGGGVAEETVILEEVPPVRKLKVEEIGEEEEWGDCSICLDEMNCKGKKRRAVIKIRCGHVYHQSCILKWLNNNNSCPLCRIPPLPWEED